MDLNNVLKIIAAIITVIIAIFAGIIEIRKNSQYWLNRFFATFFIFAAFGFFFYTLYHIILNNAVLVVNFARTAQFFFNFAMACLLMSEFIIEYSEKQAMKPRYLGFAFISSILFSVGYFIWPITLNLDAYSQGEVDTITPDLWFYSVFSYRILVMLYVTIKFFLLSRKSSGPIHTQLSLFIWGMVCVILGTLFTLLGGSISVIFEILGLFAFDAGAILILQGFLLKNS